MKGLDWLFPTKQFKIELFKKAIHRLKHGYWYNPYQPFEFIVINVPSRRGLRFWKPKWNQDCIITKYKKLKKKYMTGQRIELMITDEATYTDIKKLGDPTWKIKI